MLRIVFVALVLLLRLFIVLEKSIDGGEDIPLGTV